MEIAYETFVEALRQKLLDSTGCGGDLICFKRENEYPPTRGDRLLIKQPRQNGVYEVCALYIRELYEEFQKGGTMDEIVTAVMRRLESVSRSGCFEKAGNLDSYEKIRPDLFIRLLNLDINKQELEGAVYRTVGDIALVLYARMGEIDGCFTSIKIREYMIEKWNQKAGQVFREALMNTYYISPPRIYFWEKLLYQPEYDGENFMTDMKTFPLKKDALGNCLSTSLRTNGAVAVFLPGVAEKLGKLMEGGFYMVFTSVHEVMIHSDKCAEPEELRHVLKETVKETTPEEDFLSYYIYHYDCDTREFTFI